MWILKRKRLQIINFSLFFFLSFFAYSTIPPQFSDNENPETFFGKAKEDFLKGDHNSAYKNLLLSKSLKNDEKWRELYFLTLLGLNEPLSAISFLNESKRLSQKETFYLESLIKRQSFKQESPKFSETLKLILSKDILKKTFALVESENFILLLTENSLYKINSQGQIVETTNFLGGKELLLDNDNNVVILTNDSLIIKGKRIVLPLQIKSAISFSMAPEENFYILDNNSKLFLINSDGVILQERQLLVKNCKKIRTDKLFRVFILSSKKDILVYSPSFEPLFMMDLKPNLTGLGSISNLFVDFSGNPLILDKSGDLVFFNFKQDFLGKCQKEKIKTDCFFWDGGTTILALDKKRGFLRKLEL